jgi:hypothetical protein
VDGRGGRADAGQAESRERPDSIEECQVEHDVECDRTERHPQQPQRAAQADRRLAQDLEPQARDQAWGQGHEHVLGGLCDAAVLAQRFQDEAEADEYGGSGRADDRGDEHGGGGDPPDLSVCGRARRGLGPGGGAGDEVRGTGEQADAHGADLVEQDDRQPAAGEGGRAEVTHHRDVRGAQRDLCELGRGQGRRERGQVAVVRSGGSGHAPKVTSRLVVTHLDPRASVRRE